MQRLSPPRTGGNSSRIRSGGLPLDAGTSAEKLVKNAARSIWALPSRAPTWPRRATRCWCCGRPQATCAGLHARWRSASPQSYRRRMIDRELEVQTVGVGDIERHAVAMVDHHRLVAGRFEPALHLLLARRVGHLQREVDERDAARNGQIFRAVWDWRSGRTPTPRRRRFGKTGGSNTVRLRRTPCRTHAMPPPSASPADPRKTSASARGRGRRRPRDAAASEPCPALSLL